MIALLSLNKIVLCGMSNIINLLHFISVNYDNGTVHFKVTLPEVRQLTFSSYSCISTVSRSNYYTVPHTLLKQRSVQ